jgi:3-phosphoshikimate 1-carboxyvinyltransferase
MTQTPKPIRNHAAGCTRATVYPGEQIGGTQEVPGDKSISHRVAMFSALARGTSRIIGFLQSEDCINTLRALDRLGAETSIDTDGEVQVVGNGGRFVAPDGALDFGNSGTGMRLMAGLLAGMPFPVEMCGDASLSRRPMGRIRDPLERMGCRFEFLVHENRAPFRIFGGALSGIQYDLPVASAQVKSSILLATLFADGQTRIHEPRATRDHTERLLRVLDVPIEVDGLTIRMDGCGPDGPDVDGTEWYVPGDFSSAAYWLALAAGRPDSRICVQNVGLNPRRTALLDVLRRMGADIEVEVISEENVVEPYGDITVRGVALQPTEIGGAEIPNLIDEIPLLASLATLAQGDTRIRDAAELRVKESDRIHTTVENLRRLGADVEEAEDGMLVRGGRRIAGGTTVDSFFDHRIAMSMAVLATYAERPVTIDRIHCTDTSYPGFWGDLRHLGARVEF